MRERSLITGPHMFVANHPHVLVDGFALDHATTSQRPETQDASISNGHRAFAAARRPVTVARGEIPSGSIINSSSPPVCDAAARSKAAAKSSVFSTRSAWKPQAFAIKVKSGLVRAVALTRSG